MFSQGDRPIPGYRLEKFLGRGQFGEVWAADGPGGTLVALKFIALQQKTGIRELKSIQAVKRIKHANLCSVNAMWLLGQDGGVLDDHEIDLLIRNQTRELPSQTLAIEATHVMQNPQYLVVSMSLAEGSLEERLKQQGEGGIPRDLLVDYMLQAARGIDYLNSPVHNVAGEIVGIQHRDIKPANLLFAGDSVLVGDFGVAGAFGEYDTEATSVVGSLCYMSPESIKRIPSHSSDQYALAITYYQLRTGTLPFDPTVSFAELVDIHVRGKLKFPLVTDHEQEVLNRATSTDPKQRYASCVEFAKAIAAPVEPAQPTAAKVPWPAVVGGSVAALLLVVALLWGLFGNSGGNEENTGPQPQPHTIVFMPEQTEYTLSILPESPRDGLDSTGMSAAKIDLLPSDKVHIKAVSPNDFYQPIDQEFSYEQLVRDDWKIELQPIAATDMMGKVTSLATSGKWDTAQQLFVSATSIYPELKDAPQPESIELHGSPHRATYSPRENRVATALSGDGTSLLSLLDLAQPKSDARQVTLTELPEQVHLPHNLPWAVLMQDRVASVISLDPIGKSYEIDLGLPKMVPYRQITCSALSPDGKAILVGQDHQTVTLLAVAEGPQPVTKLATASFATRVDAVGFDPASQYCFAMGQDGDGRRWPTSDVSEATATDFKIADFDEEIVAIVPLSKDNLVAFTDTQVLRLQIAAEGGVIKPQVIETLRSPLITARLSGNGKFLAYTTESSARPLSILETDSNTLTSLQPPEVKGIVEDFDLSADSRWLVYATENSELYVLDLTQKPIAPQVLLPSQGERIKFVRLSSSGGDLVTLAEDGTTTWWNFVQLILTAKP
ncbi:WD40 repeat domain-containing serine/threonine protein kinase [Blastopirellula marina]|uniref:Protein kinase domain-containing protein n=1 Tax=Blastopirellula marina TaxID=124 RepID=A0A2S8G8B9_9BACT|nr:WD40 repeat domain-containing serine/threonine protein kinase [Blastopirellula marina]PQO40667.1 hypothetical protein C5Y98_05440 [Blastopirellula marina]PTL45627.1 hypothetical protein C5Y97_05440 [Blastopirellula marina]